MQDKGITMQDVFHEMMRRKGKAPNPKYAQDNIVSNSDQIKNKE